MEHFKKLIQTTHNLKSPDISQILMMTTTTRLKVTYYLPQCFKHSFLVVNLLLFPPQPPYMNSSHFPDSLLKNQ